MAKSAAFDAGYVTALFSPFVAVLAVPFGIGSGIRAALSLVITGMTAAASFGATAGAIETVQTASKQSSEAKVEKRPVTQQRSIREFADEHPFLAKPGAVLGASAFIAGATGVALTPGADVKPAVIGTSVGVLAGVTGAVLTRLGTGRQNGRGRRM